MNHELAFHHVNSNAGFPCNTYVLDLYTFLCPPPKASNAQKIMESEMMLTTKLSQVKESKTLNELLIVSEGGGTLCIKVAWFTDVG